MTRASYASSPRTSRTRTTVNRHNLRGSNINASPHFPRRLHPRSSLNLAHATTTDSCTSIESTRSSPERWLHQYPPQRAARPKRSARHRRRLTCTSRTTTRRRLRRIAITRLLARWVAAKRRMGIRRGRVRDRRTTRSRYETQIQCHDDKETHGSRIKTKKPADLQFSDPCHRASKASLKCLEQTHYNKGEVGGDSRGSLTSSATSTSKRIGRAKRNGCV
jgi:hypothetical protein